MLPAHPTRKEHDNAPLPAGSIYAIQGYIYMGYVWETLDAYYCSYERQSTRYDIAYTRHGLQKQIKDRLKEGRQQYILRTIAQTSRIRHRQRPIIIRKMSSWGDIDPSSASASFGCSFLLATAANKESADGSPHG